MISSQARCQPGPARPQRQRTAANGRDLPPSEAAGPVEADRPGGMPARQAPIG